MNPFVSYDFPDIARYTMAIVVIITGLLAVGYAIWWGFLMIISAGNEEKVKKAVNVIRYAAVGIVMMIVIIFAFPFIFWLLGIPYADYTKPPIVFQTIKEISGRIFGYNVGPAGEIPTEAPNTGLPPNFSDL